MNKLKALILNIPFIKKYIDIDIIKFQYNNELRKFLEKEHILQKNSNGIWMTSDQNGSNVMIPSVSELKEKYIFSCSKIITLEAALSSISTKYQMALDAVIEKDALLRIVRSEVADCNELIERLDNEIGTLTKQLKTKKNAKHKRNPTATKRTKEGTTETEPAFVPVKWK